MTPDRLPPPGSDSNQPPPPIGRRATAITIGILAVTAFVMILNETVLSVALPRLMADFGVTATTGQWLTTGFLLTMAVVIPTTGFLLQRFSGRQLFLAAVALFLLGTAVAAVAPTFGVMLLARVIQAGGTAVVLPLLMTTTLTLVSPQRRGTVMGLNSVVISVAPAVGPTLSGAIIESFDWRWVFGAMLPIALASFFIGLKAMPAMGGGQRPPLDWASVLLSLLGFGGLITALSAMTSVREGSVLPILAGVAGAVGVLLFVLRQRQLTQRTGQPLMNLAPFGVRNFSFSVGALMVGMGTMLGTVTVLPIVAQTGLGLSVLTTGLMLLPGGVTQGILGPVIGRLYDLFGPKPLVIPGTILLCVSQWSFSALNEGTSVPMIVAMHVLFSVGMALTMTPMMTHAMGSLPMRMYGHGSAILNTLQQLSGAIGTAVMVGALALGASWAVGAGPLAQVAGGQLAFRVGGVLALIGVVCALCVTRTPEQPRNRKQL